MASQKKAEAFIDFDLLEVIGLIFKKNGNSVFSIVSANAFMKYLMETADKLLSSHNVFVLRWL